MDLNKMDKKKFYIFMLSMALITICFCESGKFLYKKGFDDGKRIAETNYKKSEMTKRGDFSELKARDPHCPNTKTWLMRNVDVIVYKYE